jgi:hypothetical protein
MSYNRKAGDPLANGLALLRTSPLPEVGGGAKVYEDIACDCLELRGEPSGVKYFASLLSLGTDVSGFVDSSILINS